MRALTAWQRELVTKLIDERIAAIATPGSVVFIKGAPPTREALAWLGSKGLSVMMIDGAENEVRVASAEERGGA